MDPEDSKHLETPEFTRDSVCNFQESVRARRLLQLRMWRRRFTKAKDDGFCLPASRRPFWHCFDSPREEESCPDCAGPGFHWLPVQLRQQVPIGSDAMTIVVATLGGRTVEFSDVSPYQSFNAFRLRVAAEMGPIPRPGTSMELVIGTRKLSSVHNMLTLRELGFVDRATLTCIQAPGVIFGHRRYALTSRNVCDGANLAEAACVEYGQAAIVADFEVLDSVRRNMLTFMDDLGFRGAAFVLHEAEEIADNGGRFFICRHSAPIPESWLAFIDDQLQASGMVDGSIERVDLCSRKGRVLPVLVDIGSV